MLIMKKGWVDKGLYTENERLNWKNSLKESDGFIPQHSLSCFITSKGCMSKQ
jgi:hypothetical protein